MSKGSLYVHQRNKEISQKICELLNDLSFCSLPACGHHQFRAVFTGLKFGYNYVSWECFWQDSEVQSAARCSISWFCTGYWWLLWQKSMTTSWSSQLLERCRFFQTLPIFLIFLLFLRWGFQKNLWVNEYFYVCLPIKKKVSKNCLAIQSPAISCKKLGWISHFFLSAF